MIYLQQNSYLLTILFYLLNAPANTSIFLVFQ